MPQGRFISLEGPDGAGKSSVIKELATLIEIRTGRQVHVSREPGGNVIAERIRHVILDREHTKMDARTEALLYAAARRQHLVETIVPALEQGKIVLCDRFVDSSLAYQGVARQLPTALIWEINQFAIEGYMPELTLLIDVPAAIGLERIRQTRKGNQMDRLDQESLTFHERVRQAYLEFAEQSPKRIKLIDGTQALMDVVEGCYQQLVEQGILS